MRGLFTALPGRTFLDTTRLAPKWWPDSTGKDLWPELREIGEGAVAFLVVQSVPYDELVRTGQSYVIHRHVDRPVVRLVEQDGRPDRGRRAGLGHGGGGGAAVRGG